MFKTNLLVENDIYLVNGQEDIFLALEREIDSHNGSSRHSRS
jgi:hypothetical protein